MTFSKNESVRSLNGKNGCYWDTLKKKKQNNPCLALSFESEDWLTFKVF